MDDLVAFIRARLDEDAEHVSRLHTLKVELAERHQEPWSKAKLENDALLELGAFSRQLRYDVDAKRQIIAEHRVIDDRCHVCTAIHREGQARRFRAPCPTLRLLATPYAWHPDYRESWKP